MACKIAGGAVESVLMMDNDALFKFWKEATVVNNSSKKVLLTKKMIESNSKK